MKELFLTWCRYIANNPHPTLAGVVLFVVSVAGILWPAHKAKMDEIARLAIVYGIINANYTTHTNQVTKQTEAKIEKELTTLGNEPKSGS